MKQIVQQIFIVLSILGLLFSCTQNQEAASPAGLGFISVSQFFKQSQIIIKVIDQSGLPLQAEVLIGTALNDPFLGNLLQTDAQGQVVAPKEWSTVLPVTVRAPGYVAITYLHQSPHALTFKMRKAPMAQPITLSGTTKGYPIKDRDDQIDFGLIMKGMTKSELLAFDINKVISSDNDTFSVAGQDAQVPSNISLPRQKETYFIPITIEKNNYRLFMNEPGPQKVIALRGRFPFKKIIGELRNNKNFVDLLNEFSLDGGTLKDVTVTGSALKLNLDLAEFQFRQSVAVTAPSHAADEVMIGVAAQDMNGILMPTDVKKIQSGQLMNLKALDAKTSYVLKVLQKQSDFNVETGDPNSRDRLSVIYTQSSEKSAGQFLNLVENPKVQGQQVFLDAPKALHLVNPYATFLVLSELHEIIIGGRTTKIPLSRWEIYAPGWASQINLPQQPLTLGTGPQWRWEASFFGGVDSASDLGPDMIQKTTHVTRSSIDF